MSEPGVKIQKVGYPRIIVSLDFPIQEQALDIVDKLDSSNCRLKVGKELFTSTGPAIVEKLIDKGFDVFLDLKFHDIPNTVARACSAAASLGVWMINVHASGGRQMLAAAREAIDKHQHKPLLTAVTVLTSLDDNDLKTIGISNTVNEQVFTLARLARQEGIDGVVCSAQEVAQLKKEFGENFCLVTPGIRPSGTASDDQSRIMTPAQAIAAGSHYLVIGRPVTRSPDPLATLKAIDKEINEVAGG